LDAALRTSSFLAMDLTNVNAELIIKVITQFEEFDLSSAVLSTQEISRILTSILQNETLLKKLSLRGKNLRRVEPIVLKRALIKLEEVNLCSTKLSEDQITLILTSISLEDIKLNRQHSCSPLSGFFPDVGFLCGLRRLIRKRSQLTAYLISSNFKN